MRVVEAGTAEFRACMAEDELLDQIPVRILDAMLDCLTENAAEWAEAYWGPDWIGELPYEEGAVDSIAVHLLAVLREDR